MSEEKVSPKISLKKFKSKHQHERLAKVFDKISKFEKRIKRLMPDETKKMKWSLEMSLG